MAAKLKATPFFSPVVPDECCRHAVSPARQGWTCSSSGARTVPRSAGVNTVIVASRTCVVIAAPFPAVVRISPPPSRANRRLWLDQNSAGSCLGEGTGMIDGTHPAQSAPRNPSIRSAQSGRDSRITSPALAPRARNTVAQRSAPAFRAAFVSVEAVSPP